MSKLRLAERKKAKIRMGFSGPSGTGKTTSALLVAYGITGDWQKIAVIDSESDSASLYANHTLPNGVFIGQFFSYPLEAPFHPNTYINAIKECVEAGIEVIIIDSITHEWSGKGGCLELHEAAIKKQKIANSFTAWAEITPLHQSFIDAMLQAKAHIIATIRSRTEYVLTEKNGRQAPQKVGMALQTRDGFDFELTCSFEMNTDNQATVSKDRTGLFSGNEAFVPDISTGKLIADWCNKEGEQSRIEREELEKALLLVDGCKYREEISALGDVLSESVKTNDKFKAAANAKYKSLTPTTTQP